VASNAILPCFKASTNRFYLVQGARLVKKKTCSKKETKSPLDSAVKGRNDDLHSVTSFLDIFMQANVAMWPTLFLIAKILK